MNIQRLSQRIWDIAGGVSIRAKILGIVLGLVILLGMGVTIQARYALTGTMNAQLEEQSVSASRDLAARSTDQFCSTIYLGFTIFLMKPPPTTPISDMHFWLIHADR